MLFWYVRVREGIFRPIPFTVMHICDYIFQRKDTCHVIAADLHAIFTVLYMYNIRTILINLRPKRSHLVLY